MSARLFINATSTEIRAAYVHHGELQWYEIEQAHALNLVGNIYVGKVKRIIAKLAIAFIDIGLEREGFIQKNNIARHLHEGQQLLVQVVKTPTLPKGAQLSLDIKLSCSCLIFTPHLPQLRLSQRITEDTDQQRLTQLLNTYVDSTGGFIIRNSATQMASEHIVAEALELKKIWQAIITRKKNQLIQQKAQKKDDSVVCLYQEIPFCFRLLRDHKTNLLTSIMVDSSTLLHQFQDFLRRYQPQLCKILQLYEGTKPIFSQYGIEVEIENLLQKKVVLKSGGHLLIEPMETMVVIDVNSGNGISEKRFADLAMAINLAAADKIAQQLRLRNLSGMIIIDFLRFKQGNPLQQQLQQQQVLNRLKNALAADEVKTTIYGFTPLGLFEMVRQRIQPSLQMRLCEPCDQCNDSGMVKSYQTLYAEVVRKIELLMRTYHVQNFTIYTSSCRYEKLSHLLLESISSTQFAHCQIKIEAKCDYHNNIVEVVPI